MSPDLIRVILTFIWIVKDNKKTRKFLYIAHFLGIFQYIIYLAYVVIITF